MKNLMKTIGILTLFVLVTFVSCKKDKDDAKPDKEEQLFAMKMTVVSNKDGVVNGILVGTKKELQSVVDKGDSTKSTPLPAKMIGSGYYTYNRTHGPINPVSPCTTEANRYFAKMWSYYLDIANQTCESQKINFTCVNGEKFYRIVTPTNVDCLVDGVGAVTAFIPFPYNPETVKPEEVKAFIASLFKE